MKTQGLAPRVALIGILATAAFAAFGLTASLAQSGLVETRAQAWSMHKSLEAQTPSTDAEELTGRLRVALSDDRVCVTEEDALGAIQQATQGAELAAIKSALAALSSEDWCPAVAAALQWANNAVELAEAASTDQPGAVDTPPSEPFAGGDTALGDDGGPGYPG